MMVVRPAGDEAPVVPQVEVRMLSAAQAALREFNESVLRTSTAGTERRHNAALPVNVVRLQWKLYPESGEHGRNAEWHRVLRRYGSNASDVTLQNRKVAESVFPSPQPQAGSQFVAVPSVVIL